MFLKLNFPQGGSESRSSRLQEIRPIEVDRSFNALQSDLVSSATSSRLQRRPSNLVGQVSNCENEVFDDDLTVRDQNTNFVDTQDKDRQVVREMVKQLSTAHKDNNSGSLNSKITKGFDRIQQYRRLIPSNSASLNQNKTGSIIQSIEDTKKEIKEPKVGSAIVSGVCNTFGGDAMRLDSEIIVNDHNMPIELNDRSNFKRKSLLDKDITRTSMIIDLAHDSNPREASSSRFSFLFPTKI